MSNNEIAQKIVILNPDGSKKQLSTDSNGNLNIALASGGTGITSDASVAIQDGSDSSKKLKVNSDGSINVAGQSGVTQISDGTTIGQKLAVDSGGKIGISALPALPSGSNVIGIVIASAGSGIVLPAALTSAGNLKVAVQEGMTNVPTLIASSGTAITTTASYASIFGGPQAVTIPGTKILIDLFEQNVNTTLYQVKAGPAISLLHTLITDVALNKNADAYEVIADPFMYVDILVKDAVGGTHGSVIGYLKRG
jgi:hypothetical protein